MKYKIICLLLLLCFSLPCYGADKFNYVDPELISPQFIVPPPADNSTEWKNEVDEMIKRQHDASDTEKAAAEAEAGVKPDMMASVSPMNAADHPKTYILLNKANEDCGRVVGPTKAFWNTTRPFMADPRINATQRPGNASYPSGHTACSRIWAEILGTLSPDKRAAYRARAAEIANHRVIAGVHWPHDLVGGEQLALLLFGAMQTSKDYQNDLMEAKKEWK